MFIEFGLFDINTRVKKKYGHTYFVCTHRLNAKMTEVVFVKGGKLYGDKKLCDFIKSEKLDY